MLAADNNPAIANIAAMVKLRYGARELTEFPKIQARQMLAGGHKSRFRGRGMDFDQVRIYQPGDDVRNIDWRVTARTEVPHTKLFREERERPITIFSDLRQPMCFGSQRLKSVVACEVSAALSWAGLAANDRAGGLIFGQNNQMDVKPQRNHHSVLRFIHGLSDYSEQLLNLQSQQNTHQDGFSLTQMLEESRRFIVPGSTIFVVSDFHDLDASCEPHLFELARHGNLNFCHIYDQLEHRLPPPAVYAVSDGQQRSLLNSASPSLRSWVEEQFENRLALLKRFSERTSAGLLTFNTEDDVMAVLNRAYGKKRYRRHGG